MKGEIRFIWACCALSVVLGTLWASPCTAQQPGYDQPEIPYVASRNDSVQDMLRMADVGEEDIVYDLGSGDGRILIAAVRDFGARKAVGVEIEAELVALSRERVREAGLEDSIEIIEGDLFDFDFSKATVLTLYLGWSPNLRLRPKILRTLAVGARVVSHQFGMGEWHADKMQTVRTHFLGMVGYYPSIQTYYKNNPNVPSFSPRDEGLSGERDRISIWVVPAQVAGVWRGSLQTSAGAQEFELRLQQQFSRITGTYVYESEVAGHGSVVIDSWGTELRFWFVPSNLPYGEFSVRTNGYVDGDVIRGRATVRDNGESYEQDFELRREKTDLLGTWEWPCATGDRQVRLKVSRGEDGRLKAVYTDRDEAGAVEDIYDFGGGFYFTHFVDFSDKIDRMVDFDEDGEFETTSLYTRIPATLRSTSTGISRALRIYEDTGWLIGKGIMVNGELTGKIEFYPYNTTFHEITDNCKADSKVDWNPQRIAP